MIAGKIVLSHRVLPLLGARFFSRTLPASENHKCQLLVVGAGAGGCAEASKFTSKLGASKVIVLEPAEKHYYQPMFTLVGGGSNGLKETSRDMKSCIPAKAKWVRDSAAQFRPRENVVVTEKGDQIEYEYLIIATGLKLNYDKIPGLLEALKEPNGPVCSNYSPAYVERTFRAFQAFQSGNAYFTFPNTPIKCPGAPQKIMYIFDHYLRKTGKRQNASITYNTSLPVLFSVKHYADALWKICKARDLNVNLRTNLVEIYPEKKQALFENLDDPSKRSVVDYSFLHVTPPMGPVDALRSCPELTNEAGYVNVSKETLQHETFKNVFAIGDCCSTPNPKTAASVAGQADVVFRNLSAIMAGETPREIFEGYASCPLVTGYDSCILAEFDYSMTPRETFPFDQSKERKSMYLLKRNFMPTLYWEGLLKGLWNGPKAMRQVLSPLKFN